MSSAVQRTLVGLVASLALVASAAHAQTAICYNCPPEWADWATQIRLIKDKTGVTVPARQQEFGTGAGATRGREGEPRCRRCLLWRHLRHPGEEGGRRWRVQAGTLERYSGGLKDADGYWFTIHSGTLGFMVNVDALKGKPVPKSWHDLLKPEYRGLIGYLDPASAFVGYVGAVAVNDALGGTLDDFTPALNYFKQLKKNDPIVPKQTSYARVLSGEIPILLDYDFNAYRAKYKDKANVVFVIPSEGSVIVPYVMSLVSNDPNQAAGKKVLDFVLSDEGQAVWANAYLRPVRASAISKEAESRFLPASEYARAKALDYAKMAEVQKSFSDRYLREVQ